jgi:hypothetical protein
VSARRATGRAVCLAFASALPEFGVPEEVLTDNGKQFTARFGNGGEVMFDRICRENRIVHRLTQPATPTTTGNVERFHQTLRRELPDDVPVWPDIDTAQAAIDAFRLDYDTDRPHQSLDKAFPADRFQAAEPPAVPVKLPASLTVPVEPPALPTPVVLSVPPVTEWSGAAVEFDRVVPPSGNLQVAGDRGRPGQDRPIAPVRRGPVRPVAPGRRRRRRRSRVMVEVDGTVNRFGTVSLGQRPVVAADILSGRRVSARRVRPPPQARPSQFGCNGGCPTPTWSWSPGRLSPWAEPTRARRSPSTTPTWSSPATTVPILRAEPIRCPSGT